MTRVQIIDIYEREIENQPAAGLDVTEASKSIERALDDYCAAIAYETFLWAYELGYKAGCDAEPAERDKDDAECREEEGWV